MNELEQELISTNTKNKERISILETNLAAKMRGKDDVI
jgi:hypothetical protein